MNSAKNIFGRSKKLTYFFTRNVPGDRRAELLRRKFDGQPPNTVTAPGTFSARLESEVSKYRETCPIEIERNPLLWWKDNHTSFPLLARYVTANAAFQASSVASERILNVDKLVYSDRRK